MSYRGDLTQDYNDHYNIAQGRWAVTSPHKATLPLHPGEQTTGPQAPGQGTHVSTWQHKIQIDL